jgi:hypothetical protein
MYYLFAKAIALLSFIETAIKIRIYTLHFWLCSTCCPYRNSYENSVMHYLFTKAYSNSTAVLYRNSHENKIHVLFAKAYSNSSLAAPIETAMKIKYTNFFWLKHIAIAVFLPL